MSDLRLLQDRNQQFASHYEGGLPIMPKLNTIILTCTDNQSRNRRFGLAIGQGKTITQAEDEVQQTVEGLRAAKAIHDKGIQLGLDLPIIEEVYRVLYEDKNPQDAVRDLEKRPQGHE